MFRYSPSGELKGRYSRAEGLPPTILEGAALFDGTAWISDAVLVVEDGVVTGLGGRGQVQRPGGARRVDLAGRWLMPGLVDCRAFVIGATPHEPARPQSSRFKQEGPILAHRGVQDAHRMLSGGITGVAQLGGGDPEYVSGLRESVRTGLIAGPTILSAGRPLSPMAAPDPLHDLRDGRSQPLPGTGMRRRPSRQIAPVATPDGLRKAVRRTFVDGADLVLLLLTPGTPSEELTLSPAELAAAAHEAQRVGGRVACQATGNRPAKAAVRAGVDLLVLGPPDPDDELVGLLAEGRTAWAPSLAARADGAGPRLGAAVRTVQQRGGKIVIGTGWCRAASVTFAAEVRALLSAGLPAPAVLASATIGGAAALGLASGPLAPGSPANVIALDVDPRLAPDALGEPGRASLILHTVPGRPLTPLQTILGVKSA